MHFGGIPFWYHSEGRAAPVQGRAGRSFSGRHRPGLSTCCRVLAGEMHPNRFPRDAVSTPQEFACSGSRRTFTAGHEAPGFGAEASEDAGHASWMLKAVRLAMDRLRSVRDDSASALERRFDATTIIRRRYDRIAPLYDLIDAPMELGARRWRPALWSRLRGPRVLELGVGTGKNIPFYPAGAEVTATDISERMLARAARRAEKHGVSVRFEIADAQRLSYASRSFDCVVATFLFCSVPDPALGLAEARRVLKPGGQLLLLEHVLSRRPSLRRLMRWLDPIPFHLWGAHINRDTVETVRAAGFVVTEERDLVLDVVKQVEATVPADAAASSLTW